VDIILADFQRIWSNLWSFTEIVQKKLQADVHRILDYSVFGFAALLMLLDVYFLVRNPGEYIKVMWNLISWLNYAVCVDACDAYKNKMCVYILSGEDS